MAFCPDVHGGCRNLGSNALTGPLPGSWAFGFAQLQQVDLHENQLTDGLPPSWGASDKMQNLELLDLSSNTFTGAHSGLLCGAQLRACECVHSCVVLHLKML